ncbi:hypothetical protein KQI63_05875 [bacterium]|nr:hypothetical protein [bacterium]
MRTPNETPEIRAARKQAEKLARNAQRLAKKGATMFERTQKLIREQADLVAELVEGRDQYFEALPNRKPTEGKSFDSEDGLFRIQLNVGSSKKLNPELAEQAKTLVDRFIDEATAKAEAVPELEELVSFLTTIFQARGDRLSYTRGVHDFLAGSYTNPLLVDAQELLQQAVETSEKRLSIRYWARTSIDEPWTELPVNWFHTAEVVEGLLERRKEERRQKRQT